MLVSAIRARFSRQQSSLTARMRNFRQAPNVSDRKSKDHRWFGRSGIGIRIKAVQELFARLFNIEGDFVPDGRHDLPLAVTHDQQAADTGADLVAGFAAFWRGDLRDTELRRYWAYVRGSNPAEIDNELVAPYSALMRESQAMLADCILAAHDFGQYRSVLDVGGGEGAFLGALGVHRMYQGKWISGLLYLVTGGLFFLGVLYDFWTLNDQVSVRNAEGRGAFQ